MTKNLFKKNIAILLLFLLSVFLVSGCKKETPKIPAKTYMPEVTALTVKTGLDQDFDVTGEVFAYQESTITAETKSKVDNITVKEGDSVTSGQSLIYLSSSTVDSTLNTTSSALSNAQLSLQNTKLSSEKSIKAAEINLQTAKTNLQSVLAQNATLRKQAEETLKSSNISTDLGTSSAQTALDNAVDGSFPVVQTAFTAANKILGVTEVYKYVESDFRKLLGAAKVNSKTDAEQSLLKVDSLMTSYTKSYDDALALLLQTEDALKKLLVALNNSAFGADYTQATIATDISAINTQLGYVQTSINTLKSAKAALDQTKQTVEGGTSQADLSAKAVYDATIAKLKANETAARNQVQSAQNALDSAKQSAKLSASSASTSVTSAYGSYDQARINKDKLTVKAPFTGKVSALHVKKGEEVALGAKLITVEDASRLKIVAYLSSDDVKKVSVGDVVTINGDEISLISSVSPSADAVTKKYKVEIIHTSSELDPGELVKLTFVVGKQIFNGNRIFIPLPALHILQNEIFVWKLKDDKTVKAVVTVGNTVGDYVEVLSGLSIGDEIISEGGRLIEEEGTEVKISN